MKRTIITNIVIALLAFTQVHIAAAANLKVIAEGIEEAKGSIRFSLFNTEEGWLKDGIRADTLDAKISEIIWEVPGLEAGEYAVAIIHDVDNNGELNSVLFGKPTEPYGFSNDARGMFGPAKWEEAKFVVEEGDKEIHIRVY